MTKTNSTRVRNVAWLIATLLGSAADAASISVGGTEMEARELAVASPEAATLVANAERAAIADAPKEAWNLYGKAWALAPRSPIPGRGICRLALALGIATAEQRKAATEACTRAVLLGGTPEDIRNQVGSLVDGNPPPTMDDLVSASLAAEGAARTGPALL